MHSTNRLQNRNKCIDDIIQFEYPNESDLTPSPENIIIWNLTIFTSMVKLFICIQLHQVVIEWNQNLLADKCLEILWFWLYFIVFEFTWLSKYLYLFIQDYVTDVIFAYFTYLYQGHHYFELFTICPLLLELLDNCLQIYFLLIIFTPLLKDSNSFSYSFNRQSISCKIHLSQFFKNWILFEDANNKFHRY